MTKEEIKEVLAKFAKEMDFVSNALQEDQKVIDKEKDKLCEKLIEDLEIPYEFECDICEDTGETTVMERVYPNEPHEAPTGTQTCICRLHDNDDYGD
jgi:tartrate dehydratase alpha subunit/fumarate hydratase class I-like protein